METYLQLFEQVIKAQAEHMGEEMAHKQAKKAGLSVSKNGHIVSCTGNPQLVLLRLMRFFTESGSMLALAACMPLISELVKNSETEEGETSSAKEQESPA